jgi:ribosomal protein L16 Arg81 hydroxylase
MTILTPKTAPHFLAIQQIKNLFENTECNEIDIEYYLKDEEFSNYDEIRDILENNDALEREITYYSEAMKYLSENDNSLTESLGIASQLGYEVKNLNSELLASLLASQNLRDEFYGLENDINSICEECIEMVELDEQEANEQSENENN